MNHEGVDDWVHALPLAKLAINNSANDSIGLSLAYIVYVQPLQMPVDMLGGVHPHVAT